MKTGKKHPAATIVMALAILFLILTGCASVSQLDNGNSDQVKSSENSHTSEASQENITGQMNLSEDGKTIKLNSEVHPGGNQEMDMNAVYMEVLGKYLKDQLNLEAYDKEIAEMGCVALDKEDQSISQQKQNMGLKFIYLRNDLHTERLSNEDRQSLLEYAESDVRKTGETTDPDKIAADSENKTDELPAHKAEEVVIRTMEDVIAPREIHSDEEKTIETIYDNSAMDQDGSNMVTINSLVLQIATQAEYDENDEIIDERAEVDKENSLYSLSERMEDEMDGLLGDIPVRVLIDFIL